jgi:hypothetical protein
MSVTIKVKSSEEIQEEPKEPQNPKISLEVRKTLDGKIMIFDHLHMDIIIDTAKNKITTFPKKELSDEMYGHQSDYFNYLRREGIILPESVQSCNVYGSLEASFPKSSDESVSATQVVLLSTNKFLEQTSPAMETQEFIESEVDEMALDPTPEDSTELGEVPEEPKKGSITPYRIRRYLSGYGYY